MSTTKPPPASVVQNILLDSLLPPLAESRCYSETNGSANSSLSCISLPANRAGVSSKIPILRLPKLRSAEPKKKAAAPPPVPPKPTHLKLLRDRSLPLSSLPSSSSSSPGRSMTHQLQSQPRPRREASFDSAASLGVVSLCSLRGKASRIPVWKGATPPATSTPKKWDSCAEVS